MRESASLWLFRKAALLGYRATAWRRWVRSWENHRFDCNFAFTGGRVLRESTRGKTLASIGPDGRSNVLGAGPISFRCVEPFRKWIVSYDGEAYDGSVQQQMSREFSIYADAGPVHLSTHVGFL